MTAPRTSNARPPEETEMAALSDAAASSGISGLVCRNAAGQIVLSFGSGDDPRIKAMVSDQAWMGEALKKRVVPVLLTDKTFSAFVIGLGKGQIVLISDGLSDTVLQFLLNVDFAYDIIDLVLTDPYDAMVVINQDDEVTFLSPVHEKFFGLRPGEGIGKNVRDVIPNTRLPHVVRTGIAEVGQILRINGDERVVSRHPIRHDKKVVGAIGRIMFKGPKQVEEMARRIKDLEQKIATYQKETVEEKRGEKFLDAIIGQSPAIQSLRQQIRKLAPLDVPVLIQGDSGTGKELVASALHSMSARYEGRLVTVNAAALPANLVESELFGYESGSFTGADRKGRPGKFELADKGTIFLDEIGDMPLEVQSKLLRVLQDRVVERVGGDKAKRVDFRLCSATNRDLEAFVEQGKFRLDLFYRISPVRLILPTLNERIEDLPLLLHHFLQELSDKYGRQLPEVDLNVPDFLMDRSWPGNIRQLRHEVERAFVFSENGRIRVLDFTQVPVTSASWHVSRIGKQAGVAKAATGTRREAVEVLERELIADAMIRFKGNKKRVAEYLGMSRSYLYKKLGEDTPHSLAS
jgi:transcriptional regulator with PAS, ATPase and Fis domain